MKRPPTRRFRHPENFLDRILFSSRRSRRSLLASIMDEERIMKPQLNVRLPRRRRPPFFFLIVAPLAGCASSPVPTTIDVPGMANPEIALRDGIAEVDREMNRIGRLHSGATPRVAPPIVPGELEKVIAFEWNGSLDEGVTKLAHSIGYTVAISAPSNPQPVEIGISAGPQRVYEIFEQIGANAGALATVEVDPQHHSVQVIHHV
jgi:defect-in-organelle-trafficking protein DotD